MRKFIYIFCALLAYLLLSSRSCVPEIDTAAEQQKSIHEEQKTVLKEASKDYLTPANLKTYEAIAMQKVRDLEDYTNLYLDTSLDTDFRAKAKEMALRMFYNPGSQNIEYFLNIDSSEEMPVAIMMDSLTLSSPFTDTKNDEYQGVITFLKHIKLATTDDTISTPAAPDSLGVVLSRSLKAIGQDSVMVWNLQLTK